MHDGVHFSDTCWFFHPPNVNLPQTDWNNWFYLIELSKLMFAMVHDCHHRVLKPLAT